MSVVKPIRPGTYITVTGQTLQQVPVSTSDIIAVPITHDWGPLGTDDQGNVLVTSVFEFDAAYGNSDTAGRRAVQSALYGSGVPGYGGAGGVLVHRQAVAGSKAKATGVLTNTTPATAFTASAKYNGTRGNTIILVVEDHPTVSSLNILKLYLSVVAGTPVEQFVHTDTDVAGLAAAVNSTSNWITGVANITGVALTLTAGSPVTLAGGNDGSTLTATEYTSAMNSLFFEDFGVIAFQNLTDQSGGGAIQASVLAWVRTLVAANRPVDFISGGAIGEVLATALSRATALSDPRVINLGLGSYTDYFVNPASPTGTAVSTAQLAPRIGGLFIACGRSKSLTFARIDLLRATVGPTNSEIEQCIQGGVTCFSRSTVPGSDVKVEKGVSTFVATNVPSEPFVIFSDPRCVRVLDIFVRTMKEWGDLNVVGQGPVNDQVRDAVLGKGIFELKILGDLGLIVPGTGVFQVPDTSGDPTLRDTVQFNFGWEFALTATYLMGSGSIS